MAPILVVQQSKSVHFFTNVNPGFLSNVGGFFVLQSSPPMDISTSVKRLERRLDSLFYQHPTLSHPGTRLCYRLGIRDMIYEDEGHERHFVRGRMLLRVPKQTAFFNISYRAVSYMRRGSRSHAVDGIDRKAAWVPVPVHVLIYCLSCQ